MERRRGCLADDRHDTYDGAPTDASPWLSGDPTPRRLLRGGSWADSPRTVRATTRLTDHPGPRVGNVGLRLAETADSQSSPTRRVGGNLDLLR